MKILSIGCEPAGLYFGILMKKADLKTENAPTPSAMSDRSVPGRASAQGS